MKDEFIAFICQDKYSSHSKRMFWAFYDFLLEC